MIQDTNLEKCNTQIIWKSAQNHKNVVREGWLNHVLKPFEKKEVNHLTDPLRDVEHKNTNQHV